MISLLGESRNASWHFWFTAMPLMVVIWLILMASCLKSAPLPFPKNKPIAVDTVYETSHGYVLFLGRYGMASYGRAYHPNVSVVDCDWRMEGQRIRLDRPYNVTLWFDKRELRRKP